MLNRVTERYEGTTGAGKGSNEVRESGSIWEAEGGGGVLGVAGESGSAGVLVPWGAALTSRSKKINCRQDYVENLGGKRRKRVIWVWWQRGWGTREARALLGERWGRGMLEGRWKGDQGRMEDWVWKNSVRQSMCVCGRKRNSTCNNIPSSPTP